MCKQLDSIYPLRYHGGWDALQQWNKSPEKESDYRDFRGVAKRYINRIRDSISRKDAYFTTLTNYLLENIKAIDYNTLRDSLLKLPITANIDQKYFSEVVKRVAVENSNYYFRLAEDLPDKKDIFFDIIYGRKIVHRLKHVPGHNAVKKDFSKHKHSDRLFTYYALSSQIIVAGLVVWLIVK